MSVKWFALLLLVLVIAGCGGSQSVAPPELVQSPFLIEIDPKDHARFDEIRKSAIKDRFKDQIEYLQSRNHDLAWYPTTVGEIADHETVQMIYFDYNNYVVGFCSGSFASDNFVASAGHCNHAVYGLSKEGATCDENLLFAYKAAPNAKLQYYRCDQVMAHGYDRTEYTDQGQEKIFHSSDYTLYRLANAAGHPPMRDSYNASREWYLKTYGAKTGDILLGLAVDPPSGNQSFQSKYDVVVSEVVDGKSAAKANHLILYDGIYAKAISNQFQSGNSGCPIYRLPSKPTLKPKGTSLLKMARTFVTTLSGTWTGTDYQYFSSPSEFLIRFLDLVEGK